MTNNFPSVTTPKGVAKFPWLSNADTKFKAEGDYKVDLVVPAKAAKAFVTEVTKLRDEFAQTTKTKKRAQLPFSKEVDDQGNETGNIVIRCKVSNRVGWDRKPKQFDAQGNRIDKHIGGGSVLKVRVTVYCWDVSSLGVGVTLQPVAVQVLDLVEIGSGNNADEFGFGKEDGFVSDETFDGKGDTADEAVSSTSEADSDLY